MQLGSHPVAVVQYTYTHKQYRERHKTNNTQSNTKTGKECGPCLVFAGFTLAFALQLRKKYGKTSVSVVCVYLCVRVCVCVCVCACV